jgi:hypothetical protein
MRAVAAPGVARHSASMREPAADHTPEQQQLLADIAENGVHVVHVPQTDEQPEYSYTVGLWESFGQPEVLVFGLEEEVAEDLLNVVADEASEDAKFLPDSKHDGLLVGYPARFFVVAQPQYAALVPQIGWAYAGEVVPVVQLVWPDKQGRWPWEDGVREGFAKSQPVFGRKAP